MRRITRGVLTAMAVAFACCGGSYAFGQSTTRPAGSAGETARGLNILLIMTDQHNVNVLGCSGNPLVKTPNLDRLAAQGARITQAVCPTPFCSPTRASIRTGMWPHAHGIVYNVAPDPKGDRPRARAAADGQQAAAADRPRRADRPRKRAATAKADSDGQRPASKRAERNPGLTDKYPVLDSLLYDQGYATEHLGKWHLGPLADLRAYPNKATEDADRVGYAKWLKAQDGAIDRTPREGETFVEDNNGVFLRSAIIQSRDKLADGPVEMTAEVKAIGRSAVAARAQFETWLADRAMDWMEKHAGGPFMLTLSVSPPHAPWVVPDPYYSMYDPAKMILPATFGNLPASYKNTQAGRMAVAAGEAGIREQLRCYYGQVTEMDEQIGRVLKKLHDLGLDDKTLVIFTADHGDMQGAHGMMGKSAHMGYEEVARVPLIVRHPPTIRPGQVLDMQASSVDLMPTMLDYAGQPIPATVQGRSLRPFLDGKAQPDDAPVFCERGLNDAKTMRVIRTREWKYCAYADGRRELFNLKADPGEAKNLASDGTYKAKREELQAQLLAWMERTHDPAAKTLFAK